MYAFRRKCIGCTEGEAAAPPGRTRAVGARARVQPLDLAEWNYVPCGHDVTDIGLRRLEEGTSRPLAPSRAHTKGTPCRLCHHPTMRQEELVAQVKAQTSQLRRVNAALEARRRGPPADDLSSLVGKMGDPVQGDATSAKGSNAAASHKQIVNSKTSSPARLSPAMQPIEFSPSPVRLSAGRTPHTIRDGFFNAPQASPERHLQAPGAVRESLPCVRAQHAHLTRTTPHALPVSFLRSNTVASQCRGRRSRR